MNMKRSLFAILAAMVPFLLVGVMTVDAATQFNFSGQFRPRYEVWEQHDFDSVTLENHIFHTRARFNVEAVISENISVFLQFQSNGVWGDDEVGGDNDRAGDRRASVPNQFLADVGFHQAYALLKNVFGVQGLSTQIGRQELVLDGHRLFGNTLWTQGGQSHDAIRADYKMGNLSFMYFFSKGTENSVLGFVGGGSGSDSDKEDLNTHVVYASMNGVLGGKFSAYFVATDDDSFNDDDTAPGDDDSDDSNNSYPRDIDYDDNNIYTIGARQAGQLFGLDYRVEGYYQWGDAAGIAQSATNSGLHRINDAGCQDGDDAACDTYSRSAYMFGVRVGKKFQNVMWKPSFTIFYDHLSGNDDDDYESEEWSAFNTLFDTGHKYYGFMDTFLASTGADTNYLGLQDLALKTSIQPTSKITLKADLHFFWTETDVDCNSDVDGCTDGENVGISAVISDLDDDITADDYGSYLGTELDITMVYKYAPSTTFTIGYSHYWADNWFAVVNKRGARSAVDMTCDAFEGGCDDANGSVNDSDGDGDGASWAYVQMDVRF
ncbi:MAG: alginate export family protein [Nitrospinales bacterium]